jgi:SAM-dependent methyltransferase/uncharacterized protein YbaR (Trm112 family)
MLISMLRCPLCRGRLRSSDAEGLPRSAFSVLRCGCSRYPVVAGIPILKTDGVGPAGLTADQVASLVTAGLHREALLALVSPLSPALAPAWMQLLPPMRGVGRLKRLGHAWRLRGWRREALRLLIDPADEVTAVDVLDLRFRVAEPDQGDVHDYFMFRFSQPRHLVALSFVSLVRGPAKPVLDLACGYGHITRGVLHRVGGQVVVGVDRDFFGLYIAKHWIAPGAEFVCCDADRPLPFGDETFSAVVCSDAFHYFLDKAASLQELRRVTDADGLIILAVVRNGLVHYPHAGRALTPEGYQTLVIDIPHRLVVDADVLARYLRKQGPPLARSADLERLAAAPLLSILATHSSSVFKDHGGFEDWPHAAGVLGVNPLYVVSGGRDESGTVTLRREFPSAWYEEDNSECKQYLPEQVRVSSRVLTDLEDGGRTPEIDRLMDHLVVLGLPQRFGRFLPRDREALVR